MRARQTGELCVALVFAANALLFGQDKTVSDSHQVSSVWNSDNGDGTYRNPVLYAYYSAPDLCVPAQEEHDYADSDWIHFGH